MAPGAVSSEDTTRNANANYNRTKPKKSLLRMPTQMQNKLDHGAEDDFSLSLLNESQMTRLKRAFSIFDKDDSGKISSAEMMGVRPLDVLPPRSLPSADPTALPSSQVLRLLGTNPTNGELEDIIASIDINKDGFIDFLEFARVWWGREQQNIQADFDIELELAFKVRRDRQTDNCQTKTHETAASGIRRLWRCNRNSSRRSHMRPTGPI